MIEILLFFGCLWASYKVTDWAEKRKDNNNL